MIFSFFGTLATLSLGSRLGICLGKGIELVVIVAGLALTLLIGVMMNRPHEPKDKAKK
jgi:hypothetical protein